MSSFVCAFICSISSCSLSPFLLVVDTSPIPMISLESLLLSYVDTEGKQNLYATQFQFLSLEEYVDEILIAETTTIQHCGLIITYCLLEDLDKLVKIY